MLFFVLRRFLAQILRYKRSEDSDEIEIFVLMEDNMTTRRKLTLINGTMDTEGGVHTGRRIVSKLAVPLILLVFPPCHSLMMTIGMILIRMSDISVLRSTCYAVYSEMRHASFSN